MVFRLHSRNCSKKKHGHGRASTASNQHLFYPSDWRQLHTLNCSVTTTENKEFQSLCALFVHHVEDPFNELLLFCAPEELLFLPHLKQEQSHWHNVHFLKWSHLGMISGQLWKKKIKYLDY